MRARAQAPSLRLSFSRARALANARAQKKRCTADQTDVTTLPAHSALFGENKAPVRAEGEAQTVKTFPKSGLHGFHAATVSFPECGCKLTTRMSFVLALLPSRWSSGTDASSDL